jgi:hypothetical protein
LILDRLPGRKARCRCDCGTEVIVHCTNLGRDNTTSCGCFHRERSSAARFVHGHAVKHSRTREYRIWTNMKTRCSNPNADNYSYYGGRGIRVCSRWAESFAAFLEDMGACPSPDHTIDRINADGDYEPGNCRWATMKLQSNNRARRGFRAAAWHRYVA